MLKIFLIFQEIQSSCANIKNFFKFSKKKAFLIFQETKTPEKLLTFQETETLKTSKAPRTKTCYASPKKIMNKFFQKHCWIIVSIFLIN